MKDRAKQLEEGGQEGREEYGDEDAAELAARRILEDSEERTHDPATTDYEDDSVTRRSSREHS